jgi:hypothetical protein
MSQNNNTSTDFILILSIKPGLVEAVEIVEVFSLSLRRKIYHKKAL